MNRCSVCCAVSNERCTRSGRVVPAPNRRPGIAACQDRAGADVGGRGKGGQSRPYRQGFASADTAGLRRDHHGLPSVPSETLGCPRRSTACWRILVDDDPAGLEAVSHRLGERILATPLPQGIDKALQAAASHFPPGQRFAVRSSAIGEDGEISFAGQYTSVLNVAIPDVSQAYRQVIASLYSASALSYRMHHGLDDRETPMGVLVLAMVQPQYSGVLYTADPTGDDREHIRISAVAGLGDQLVGGDASPEQMFRLDKKTLAILEAKGIADPDRPGFLRELAGHALRMEEHYQRPLDIEWAVDQSDRVFILQVRPLLVVIEEDHENAENVLEYPDHPVLLHGGKCAAGGVVSGRVLLKTRN